MNWTGLAVWVSGIVVGYAFCRWQYQGVIGRYKRQL